MMAKGRRLAADAPLSRKSAELQVAFLVKVLGLASQFPVESERQALWERLWGGLLLISTVFLQLEIKTHVFFSPINWDDLYHKRLTPPFNPNVVRGHQILDSGFPGLVGVGGSLDQLSIYRRGNRGSKRLNDLSKATQ